MDVVVNPLNWAYMQRSMPDFRKINPAFLELGLAICTYHPCWHAKRGASGVLSGTNSSRPIVVACLHTTTKSSNALTTMTSKRVKADSKRKCAGEQSGFRKN